MQRHLRSSLLFLFTLFSLVACGGGGGSSTQPDSGNIDNVVVDPQAYYIDAVNGNDANDGKTPQSAWETLNKLNTVTINAGNKILFRTGQRWQGSLEIKNSGTTDNPIVIGSYGEGAAPIISATGTVSIHENNHNQSVDDNEWIPYSAIGNEGLGAEFKEPVTDPAHTWLAVILNTHPDRIKVGGKEIPCAFDSTELGNDFKWSYNRDKKGTVFYWYGEDKPSAIETNLYAAPLYIRNSQHIKVKNLTLEGGFVAGLFLENANHIDIDHVTTGNMAKQGIYVKAENSTSDDIRITGCTIDSHYTVDYSMATPNLERNGRTTTTRGASEGVMFWGGVSNSVISDCLIKNWTHANINMSADNAEQMTNNRVSGNELLAPDIAYGGRLAIDGKNAANNEVSGNTIHDIRAPIQFNGHDNSFHDNSVYNVFESPVKPNETGDAIILQAYTAPVYNNRIVNNTFRNIAKEAIQIIGSNVTNITTTSNTIE